MATLTIRPNGDYSAGFSNADPSGNHYENVDEDSADDYTTWNGHFSGNAEDIYSFQNHTTEVGAISSVVLYARALHNYSEDKIRLKINDSYSGYLDEGGGWGDYSYNAGGSWTWELIDSLVAGIAAEVATDRVVVSQIYIIVTYTAATAPVVSTSAATNIKNTSATGSGNVTSDGGSAVTERGICYGTSINPTTAGSKVTASGTTGAFSVTLPNLLPGRRYYARAYATNAVGTTYGDNITFTTRTPMILSF